MSLYSPRSLKPSHEALWSWLSWRESLDNALWSWQKSRQVLKRGLEDVYERTREWSWSSTLLLSKKCNIIKKGNTVIELLLDRLSSFVPTWALRQWDGMQLSVIHPCMNSFWLVLHDLAWLSPQYVDALSIWKSTIKKESEMNDQSLSDTGVGPASSTSNLAVGSLPDYP